jgi:DNA-directed RNA polymerase specialized sigma24 family protein
VSLLEDLGAKHSDWLRMAEKLGGGIWSEDIVQEMYLRLYRYIDNPDRIRRANGQINTFFIYVVISNMVKDLKKAEGKFPKISLDSEWIPQDEVENALQSMADLPYWDDPEILELVTEELNSWHWYDKEVFKLFYHRKNSLRKLADDSNISVTSLFNTMKNAKERIRAILKGIG